MSEELTVHAFICSDLQKFENRIQWLKRGEGIMVIQMQSEVLDGKGKTAWAKQIIVEHGVTNFVKDIDAVPELQ
jgi:hypothetical protein